MQNFNHVNVTESLKDYNEIDILEDSKKTLSKTRNNKENLKFKDVGYAWVVLAAMFMSNMLTNGYVKNFGIIYNAILDVYPKTSATMSGVMMGLMIGCKAIFTPIAGSICNRIGIRRCLWLGGTMYVTAMLASFFCTSVLQLCFTLGALAGLSMCIIETCQVVVIPQYFDSRISQANGIRVSGNSFGGILLSIVFTFFLQTYGLHLTFILLSSLIGHIFVCSFLIRPIGVHVKIKIIDYINKLNICDLENVVNEESSSLTSDFYSSDNFKLKKKELYNEVLRQNHASIKEQKTKPLNLSIFKNSRYIFYILMAAFIPMAVPLVTFYTIIYAKAEIKLSPYEISVMASFQSIFDFFFRIFIGWLNYKKLYKLSHGFVFCMWCSALGSVLVPFMTNLWGLICVLGLYSCGPSSFQIFINVMLCDTFGKNEIVSTWGFVRMTQGIFAFIHPTLIGFILDQTESFTAPFLVMGFGLMLSGSFILLDNFLFNRTTSNITVL